MITPIGQNTYHNLNFGAKFIEENSGTDDAADVMMGHVIARSEDLRSLANQNSPELAVKYAKMKSFFVSEEGKKMLEKLPKDDSLIMEKVYCAKNVNGSFTPYLQDVFIAYNPKKLNEKLEYSINVDGTFEKYWQKPKALLMKIKSLIQK